KPPSSQAGAGAPLGAHVRWLWPFPRPAASLALAHVLRTIEGMDAGTQTRPAPAPPEVLQARVEELVAENGRLRAEVDRWREERAEEAELGEKGAAEYAAELARLKAGVEGLRSELRGRLKEEEARRWEAAVAEAKRALHDQQAEAARAGRELTAAKAGLELLRRGGAEHAGSAEGDEVRASLERAERHVQGAGCALAEAVRCLAAGPQARGALRTSSQRLLLQLADASLAAQAAITSMSESAQVASRSGYLTSLDELLPPPSEDLAVLREESAKELPRMIEEFSPGKAEELKLRRLGEGFRERSAGFVDAMVHQQAWPRDAAEVVYQLSYNVFSVPLAAALQARDRRYAASTHLLHRLVCEHVSRRRAAASGAAPRLYRNLTGQTSLVSGDPAWAALQRPADATGFRGLVCGAVVTGSNHPCDVTPAGMAPKLGEEHQPQDSDVVCFESSDPDASGNLHSAVMLSDHLGLFPPHTLFRVKKVLGPPFDAFVDGGTTVSVNQRCFVVAPTFRPAAGGVDEAGSKLTGSVATLSYGSLKDYVAGPGSLADKPVLTMEMEFGRAQTWTDWKGVSYSLQECWQYVCGPAEERDGCTPGTRDRGNSGVTPSGFRDRISGRSRTAGARAGAGTSRSYALLTHEEVLAVRLYSGPAYDPLNRFLRQASLLYGESRQLCSGRGVHVRGNCRPPAPRGAEAGRRRDSGGERQAVVPRRPRGPAQGVLDPFSEWHDLRHGHCVHEHEQKRADAH
ncbi:unnamed protein product, partial [Prorocentrum cordatum]